MITMNLLAVLAFALGIDVPLHVVGELRRIHKEGDASPVIRISDINTLNLYAIGPVAGLQGEILVVDGRVTSTRREGGTLVTSHNDTVQAALLGYSFISAWKPLLTTNQTMHLHDLDSAISNMRASASEPCWVRFQAIVDSIHWHVIHWPLDVPIEPSNHKRHAHYGVDAALRVDVVGVYAPQGAGVITHHSSNLHLHAITARGEAVHVEDVVLPPGTVVMIGSR
jgi:acetolactate decarboxylase